MPKADLVLEGGGVKGLGLVGAVLELQRQGYTFERLAGTSAGSIVAAFLAAGATADQLTAIMGRLDYRKVPDRAGVPLVGEGLGLLGHSGAHPGNYVHGFVRDELEQLGVTTFADLERELVVTATDITRGRLLRLPWDYASLDLDPDEQLVADAVRASISIPLFFEPVKLGDRELVDGGVLSNFPIEIFDVPEAALADVRGEGDPRRCPRRPRCSSRASRSRSCRPSAGAHAGRDDGAPRPRPDLPRSAVRAPPRDPGRHQRHRDRRLRRR